MRVFIFGMIGPPHRLCVHLCLSVCVCKRKIERGGAPMAVVQVHRHKPTLRQSTRGYLEFSEKPLEIWLRKQILWFVQTCSRRGRIFPPLAIPGPQSVRKNPPAHPWLLWLLPGLSLVWLRPGYRLYTMSEILVSSGENTPEPWLLLVLKFSISSNFIFLQDTLVEFIKVPLKHPAGTYL